MFYVYQMPVPRLTADDAAFAPLVEQAAKLICTSKEFDDLAKTVGLNPPDHRAGVTDPAARAKLRAELDGRVAHLYRLEEKEFAHILSTFPIVAKEIKEAALAEFVRLRDSGEAAVFNPDLLAGRDHRGAETDPSRAVRGLIAAGESAVVEFKSSARWDVRQNQPGRHIERIIAKTVAAFMNAEGGTLLIGVEDNGTVRGLAEDYTLCGDKGRDGFENWLMQMLLKDFGKDAAGLLSVAFHELNGTTGPGGDVCRVSVKPSARPRFVVEEAQVRFYIRIGNATHPLKPSELLDYCKQRWPEA